MQKGPQGKEAQKQQEWDLEKGITHPTKQIALIKKMCHVSKSSSIGNVIVGASCEMYHRNNCTAKFRLRFEA